MLYSIALQHVKTGGTAVYDARVMLDLDVVDFDNGQARIATEVVETPVQESKVYPNPTTGEAVLEITLGEGQTGFVEVLSLTGQRLFNVPLNTGTNLAPLDLSGYAQGVYMYRVFVNNEFTDAGRIIRND
ncbi:MAG: T9SS type A sorting domain-containing protein [Bacteroidia bacterium]|nr:T9SS type A sorting domain-containing protein [Bacteroidia bacterium]